MSLDREKAVSSLNLAQRRRLSLLVAGAVVVRHMGAYALYQEVEGKARPMGSLFNDDQFAELVRAVPELQPLQPGYEAYAYRLPAGCRNAYADLLQQSMPGIDDLVAESRAWQNMVDEKACSSVVRERQAA